MAYKFQVKSFLCLADKVILFFDSIKLRFERVQSVQSRVGSDIALNWTCFLPLLEELGDLVLDDLILRDDL